MRRNVYDIEKIQQRISSALMENKDEKDEKVEIRAEDAMDVVFLLEIIKVTKQKMEEIMK
jgi:hypothetical protein